MRPRRIGSSHVVSRRVCASRRAYASRRPTHLTRRSGFLAGDRAARLRRLLDLRAALQRAAVVAALLPRLRHFARQRRAVGVAVDHRPLGFDDRGRDRRRPVGPQDRHGGVDRAVVAGDPARSGGAELAELSGAARARRRDARRPAGGGDGLSRRRARLAGDRLRHGPLHRRHHARRHVRPPARRGDQRILGMAAGGGGRGGARLAGRAVDRLRAAALALRAAPRVAFSTAGRRSPGPWPIRGCGCCSPKVSW